MANAEGQRALSHSPIKGRDRHISGPRSASGAPFRVFWLKMYACCLLLVAWVFKAWRLPAKRGIETVCRSILSAPSD